MSESVTLTEADLALVEALQVSPRAPWSAVAVATGSSPATVARRWSRLVESGAAWVTATPGMPVRNAQCLAYVRVRCSPGRNLAVAQTLAADPHALSVELTAGDFDLFLTVATADLHSLSRYVMERIDLVPGIVDTQTQICTHLYREGSRWRLGTLPSVAAARLPARPESQHPAEPAGIGSWGPEDQRLMIALGLDGRSSYASLAASTGRQRGHGRRRVTTMLAGGALVLRAEVAAHLSGWRVPVMLGIDAPSAVLAETAADDRPAAPGPAVRHPRRHSRRSSSPRGCATSRRSTTSRPASPGRIPQITVSGRMVTLRTVKRTGRLLDEHGSALGAVPMDIWSDPVASAGATGS